MRDTLDLRQDECDLLAACLNEVLNGVRIEDLDKHIDLSYGEMSALLTQLKRGGERIRLGCSVLSSVAMLIRSLTAALDTEFSIRTGFTTEEADDLARFLEANSRGK